ncbi:MAG: Lrp/AsnC family transcriptional regulator [Leucobacter sp.]
MNDFQLTETDRRIIQELAVDGRMPYKDLASRVGLPVSTCHGRVRALEQAGVIRGYRADIDPVAAGRGVEALISVTVNGRSRNNLLDLTDQLRGLPCVQQVFLIGGDRDVILHVACASVPALRDLISTQLAPISALEQTRTSIVFERFAGTNPA